MASHSAVQNFSLPSRTGSARPFSPSIGDDGDSDPGTATGLNFDRNPICSPTSALTPASSALQLFHFTDCADNVVARAARHSRMLPRPMSTSSSAPAMIGIGDNNNNDNNTVVVSGTAPYTTAGDIQGNSNEPGPRENLLQTPQKTRSKLVNDNETCPDSPALSVWPRPMSVLDAVSLAKRSPRSGQGQQRIGGDSVLSRTQADIGSHHENASFNNDNDNDNENQSDEPPSLARSISIRWGPRLRHISLSEVQAADDAARRVASVRRERRVFWSLVALALVGVLSCTGAITLAAAQAAMQAGVEEIGPDENGGGPIWDSRTLGWLVASLLVCTSAVVGLAVATSARCRRRRDAAADRDDDLYSSSPGEKALLAQLVQSSTRDGNTRETRKSRAGWVEMEDLDEQGRQAGQAGQAGQENRASATRWWSFEQRGKEARGDCGDGSTERDKAAVITSIDGANDARLVSKDLPTPGVVPLHEEDRNWHKFVQDPVQLRRYVEALEARLAAVEGVRRVYQSTAAEAGGETGRLVTGEASVCRAYRAQPGFVRSPAMACLPRELVATPDTEEISTGSRWYNTGPWGGSLSSSFVI
ncbi:MAG: hypothetical protein STHCBS139747_005272 [Sporothrix thermara]